MGAPRSRPPRKRDTPNMPLGGPSSWIITAGSIAKFFGIEQAFSLKPKSTFSRTALSPLHTKMRCRLPQHQNPRRFSSLDVYADEYNDCYSMQLGRYAFHVENSASLRLWLVEGINGEDVSERSRIIDLLRTAAAIHRKYGNWPELTTDWNDMCPGGVLKLDVTILVANINSELPELLNHVSSQIDCFLASSTPFKLAEDHYREELIGLGAFDRAMDVMQTEFDAQPVRALTVYVPSLVANASNRKSPEIPATTRARSWRTLRSKSCLRA